MRKFLAFAALLILSKTTAQNWSTEQQYIQRFALYAVEEMEKYKIPASITLAQGLLETGGGQSRLALQGNNHFGIKCKEDWTGRTMAHTDDAPNECFRVYDNPRESYEDHSKFLATRKYYAGLFKLDPKDYKAWAHGLKKAGYATNPRYAYILLDKIEKYRLYEYDQTNPREVFFTILRQYPELRNDRIFMAQLDQSKTKSKPVTITVPYSQTSYAKQQQTVERIKSERELLNTILVKNHPNGDRKFIVVPANTNIDFLAEKFGIRKRKLMSWNELDSERVLRNDILFLESKSSNGNTDTYRARAGESMHDISQKFAVKLSKLYAKNRMAYGDQPRAGQLIYLSGRKPRN